jgi:sterol desaturase/sphingolipid hydroxylase (fatty acid hydroxylase superfamily)
MQYYRLPIFIISLIIFHYLERRISRSKNIYEGGFEIQRVMLNFSMLSIYYVLKLFIPFELMTMASEFTSREIGLFNILEFNLITSTILTVIFLDFIIYWQHRLFHRIPILWRLHKVHHCDKFLDVTSAFRFHPLEMILSFFIKLFFIYLLGATASGVFIFEVLLSGLAIFNHSNLKIPKKWNRYLSKIVATPDYHLVHHSTRREIHDSNYGFNLVVWDHLFSSFNNSEEILNEDFETGLNSTNKETSVRLLAILLLPFKK